MRRFVGRRIYIFVIMAFAFITLAGYMTFYRMQSVHAAQTGKGGDMLFKGFSEVSDWINTAVVPDNEVFKGHVLLLDFWTYCCINCIHVLPDLDYLEKRFEGEPFHVIGVHTAKFSNERETENIKAAVDRYGITHPVVADNDYGLWRQYGIKAWPTFLLVGSDGKVIGAVSGEGRRHILEEAIAEALDKGRRDGTLASAKRPIPLSPVKSTGILSYPGKIDIKDGIIAVSDSGNNRIVIASLTSVTEAAVIKTAGSGRGFADGNPEEAMFNAPQGVFIKGGKVYAADTGNHAIREVDIRSGYVRTIAGTGKPGLYGSGGGQALETALNSPWDIAISGDHMYIAMAGNHQIWRMDLKRGTINPYAGSGRENIRDGRLSDAMLAQPSGISIHGDRVFFADSEVSAIRYADISKNTVDTISGTGLFEFGLKDGIGKDAAFQHPLGVDYRDGSLYVADTYNDAVRIVDLATFSVSTLIGPGPGGLCTSSGLCSVLGLFEPNDVKMYDGALYIADTNNHIIRVWRGEGNTIETVDLDFTRAASD